MDWQNEPMLVEVNKLCDEIVAFVQSKGPVKPELFYLTISLMLGKATHLVYGEKCAKELQETITSVVNKYTPKFPSA